VGKAHDEKTHPFGGQGYLTNNLEKLEKIGYGNLSVFENRA
jgi:hypothetical protein